MIASKTALSSEAVAGHYDELDHFYREIWGEHVHHGFWRTGRESSSEAARQLVELVASRGKIERGKRVCDIGCGYGATARMLARDFGAAVTAMTVSPAQFHFAQAAADGEDVRYLLGDWLRNDLPAENFDVAVAIESSEHMTDKPAFFVEAHRVLHSGGRLVICAWLAREHASSVEKNFLLEPICREGRMPGMGTELDYKRFYEQAGFIFDSFEDVTARVKKHGRSARLVFSWSFAGSRVTRNSSSIATHAIAFLPSRFSASGSPITSAQCVTEFSLDTSRSAFFRADFALAPSREIHY